MEFVTSPIISELHSKVLESLAPYYKSLNIDFNLENLTIETNQEKLEFVKRHIHYIDNWNDLNITVKKKYN